jgi:ureidoglycolate dehydrogenase (NAD+)
MGINHSLDTGAINPGGHKGFGMLLMIDFLSGALVGADMGMDHINKKHPNKGHFLIAINPTIFGEITTFKMAVTARIEAIRSSKKAPGVDAILIPGEGSFARRRKALEQGTVQIDCLCWQDGIALAKTLGVALPN